MHFWRISCAVAAVALPLAPAALAQTGKTAEEAFKNIKALKGTPADQLIPAMQFMSASLGVECDFCHVAGKFDSDEKRSKQTARQMIGMTLAINKDDFNGRREVSCYSCHRGAHEPVGVPPVESAGSQPERREEPAPPAGQAPTAEQVLEKYVAAAGGAAALRKISTRVEKGAISFAGHESPIEVFAKAPDKRMSITRMGNGESITAFDGTSGWLGSSGRPPREMSGAEADAARMDAEFYLPIRLKEIFSRFRAGRPEKIGDSQAYTVFAMREGQPPVRLYFDQSSGLLLRLVRYADTPVGRNLTQIDYEDYREVDGIKLPFRWTLARPGGRFTIQIQEVRQNVPVPDDKFAKPRRAAGSAPDAGGH